MDSKMRVAVFIDAENTDASSFDEILATAKTLGLIRIMRCYGSAASLKGWEATNSEHHIVPVLTLLGAVKANASDFALIIDAVSLLHRAMFDQAVIVSSDSDFTQLAVHIREFGKGSHGVGNTNANDKLKSAFDSFTTLSPKTKPIVSLKVKTKIAQPIPKKKTPSLPVAPALPKKEILETFKTHAKNGSIALGAFGTAFRRDYPTIEIGKGKLKKMLIGAGMMVDSKLVVTGKSEL